LEGCPAVGFEPFPPGSKRDKSRISPLEPLDFSRGFQYYCRMKIPRIALSLSLAMRKLITAWTPLVLCLAVPSIIVAQPTNRVQLLGHLFIDHGVMNGNYYSNCWGYTDPSGREYALMGAISGLSIVDITEPDSLREVAFVPGIRSTWREIKTHSHYAYVVTDVYTTPDSLLGTTIVDLSGLPDSVRLVRRWVYTSGSFNTKLAHTISIHDGYLYLNGCANWPPGAVLIFSLADPENPTYVGSWGTEYIHDSMVRNDTMFAAAIYSPGGLNIVDVTDKSNPRFITKITYPGAGTHNAWTTEDGRYVVTTDEIGTTEKNLKIWDIRNLPLYAQAATFTVDPTATVHNVHIKGRYAYVAWYTAGAHVVDLADPTQPVYVGGYDTFLPTPTSPYQGCWGVFPYYNSNKFIASDRQSGLYVFALDTSTTGIENFRREIPSSVELLQNYPNPFNPSTTIRFSLPQREHVTLKLFDVLGREIVTLVDEELNAGEHTVVLDAKSLASGVYFYQLRAAGFIQTKKMLIIK